MDRNFIACFPGKYIQGAGAIFRLEQLVRQFGNKAVLITSSTAGRNLPAEYTESPLSSLIHVELFGGECCEEELTRMAESISREKAQVIIGMGGGKVIDTAKIAADRAGLPVLVVPTIASTDAPCSGCAVTYTADGVFEKVHYQRLNPSVVLVDMHIIAQAPVRFLVAGMGDALATWFEARSCAATSSMNECGGLGTWTGHRLARLCYEVLLEQGVQAKKDNEAGVVSLALHRIAEANILLSGIGFESGGLASAHAIHNGLTALPETHTFYHGEKVAFGLLAGMHLNGATQDEIQEVYTFCQSIGLPTKLTDLGISPENREGLRKVALKTTEPGSSIHHEGSGITPEWVFEALLKADAYGRSFVNKG
jgi:glycerol dehydrogenase